MLFCVIILNLFSSYLISSIARNIFVIYVAFFAFIILNMEILSLFSKINEIGIVILSFLNFILSFMFFKLKKSNFLTLNFDFKRLKNALLLDKSLIYLLGGFFILLIVTFFLSVIMPVIEPDSQTYHFLRAYNFIKFQNLNHFETNDIRALIMPINSEIVYAWLYLFKKNLYGYGILSFVSFLTFILAFFDLAKRFKYPYRKILFAIFIFTSFPSVIVQIPSLQTDIITGCLLFLGFYFYTLNSKILLYFSTLSLSLALGTKTTAVMSLLGFFVLIILYEKLIIKKINYKKLLTYSAFLFINFMIFSSYNYILNFIQFHNFFTNNACYLGHSFWGGIKGYIANLLNFLFQSLDFTGFKWGYYLNEKLYSLKDTIFNFLNINPLTGSNVEQTNINIFTDEHTTGFGILGFLVFIPILIKSLIKIRFNKNKKTYLNFIFAIVFIINILILAKSMAYMVYSIRFIVTFSILSSFILIQSYSKKGIYKAIISFFCIFYILLIPFCIKRMPFFAIFRNLKAEKFNLEALSENCYRGKIIETFKGSDIIYDTILKKYPKADKIGVLKTLNSSYLYLVSIENKNSKKLDFLNAGTINNQKLKKYDLIILETIAQNDNVFNQEDIKIRYDLKNNNVIFKDNKELNCYYKYLNYRDKNEINPENAIERVCFSYFYLENNPYFRLDYADEIDLGEEKEKIYYYLKRK